jgi:DNA-binding LacI/PurR family transcriptional regulator
VPLTTIRAPMVELGKRAAEILIRSIESSVPIPIERVVFDAEFIVRESTKALTPVRDGQLFESQV